MLNTKTKIERSKLFFGILKLDPSMTSILRMNVFFLFNEYTFINSFDNTK